MSDSTTCIDRSVPRVRRLATTFSGWRVGVLDALSFVLRCLVGLVHLRRYAGFLGLARVKGRPDIVNEGEITIGTRVIVINKYLPCEIHCAKGARIAIGRNVQINYGVLIAARKSVTIGDNVLVGNLSVISDVNFPKLPAALAPDDDPPLPIEIGDDVWLAARVTVLPGAKIGRGSVIGAGSVVKGTIPPGVIAMGNPARPLLRIGEARAVSSGRHPGRSEAEIRDRCPLPGPRRAPVPGSASPPRNDGAS